MRHARTKLAGVLIVATAFAAAPAAAHLTGTYQGSFRCKWTNNDGTKQKETTHDSTLKIISNPGGAIDVDIDETPYCGRVIETNGEKKGVGVFIVVGTNGNPSSYNEIEYISWKTTGKARVKKRGFWVDGTSIGECKGGWSRVSEETPTGNFGYCNFF